MGKIYTIDNFEDFLNNYPIIRKFISDAEILTDLTLYALNENVHDYCWTAFIKVNSRITQLYVGTNQHKLFCEIAAELWYQVAQFKIEEGASMEAINKFLRISFINQANHAMFCNDDSEVQRWFEVVGAPFGDCSYADSVNGKYFELHKFENDCHIATDKCTSKYGYCRCEVSSLPKKII